MGVREGSFVAVAVRVGVDTGVLARVAVDAWVGVLGIRAAVALARFGMAEAVVSSVVIAAVGVGCAGAPVESHRVNP